MLGVYHPMSPLAPATVRVDCSDPALRGGVFGLGLGVLAAFAFQQQVTVFIQVDNEVRDVAQGAAAESIRDFQE